MASHTAHFFWYLFIMFASLVFWTFFGMTCVALTPALILAQLSGTFMTPLWTLLAGAGRYALVLLMHFHTQVS